ncbi:GNAT family N-acetyltransferase [Testudinibacter sp. TR-2022]|uniref:GNAT family N-acetyltransferase n=1 Tax=Testudinibacter sp. TR-2022 TaxID=2585029 RepID=UPI00111AD4DD|nr:GNAT family N-acetyltransferase [Testudinibacter sp. TR-2022]TNH04211.1 N-acetyltransferase family protein [Pasteurellaceae bacterium Phil11]TNH24382.1 N-acetyltransferase family protein [Testudinibacter sp. TR-2022]TNH27118.1 N-acetyltransferase family protein [Testudinibacter sp. TR-2022]
MTEISIQPSATQDLNQIVAIYNQTIACRHITSDLEPISVADRQAWFEFHQNNPRYPIWSVRTHDNRLIGWATLSPFYGRPAYGITAEASFYLDKSAQGKGIGSQVVRFLQQQMQPLQFSTLLGFVFKGNPASAGVLQKCGFQIWGELPNVADMQQHKETLLLLGYQA